MLNIVLKKCIGVFILCFLYVSPSSSYTTSPEDRFLDRFFERCELFLGWEECQNIQEVIQECKRVCANTKRVNRGTGTMFKRLTRIIYLCALLLLPNNSYVKSPEDRFLDQFFEQCGQHISRGECQDIIEEFRETIANTKELNTVISSISRICKEREGLMYGYFSTINCEEHDSTKVEMAQYVERAKHLIEKGADINTINDQNKSMLSVAAETNSPALTQWLIDHGAHANLTDCRGITALITAIAYDSPMALEALLKNGANLAATGNEEVVLFFVKHFGYTELERLLYQYK